MRQMFQDYRLKRSISGIELYNVDLDIWISVGGPYPGSTMVTSS